VFRDGDKQIVYFMYYCVAPSLDSLKVHEKADLKFFTVKQSQKLKITDIDKIIILEFADKILNQISV